MSIVRTIEACAASFNQSWNRRALCAAHIRHCSQVCQMRTTQILTLPTCTLFAAITISGCTAVAHNPYGLPYSHDNLMSPGPLHSCTSAHPITTAPQLDFGTLPLYPMENRLSGRTGKATLAFTVSQAGVIEIAHQDSPEDRYYGSHAAIAMRDWRIKPATSNGMPIAVKCRLQFVYRLE